jgi:predicted HNH restriction endonuclease
MPKTLGGRDRKRFLVRARDNFACQVCGFKRLPSEVKNGKKSLDVHHINGLCGKLSTACKDEVDMSQMITVCHRCHYNRLDHSLKYKNLTNPQSTTGI